MKTIVTIIAICFLCTISFGQKITLTSRKNTVKNIKASTFQVLTGIDKEFDEAVKFAFDKYWTFSKIKYVANTKDDLRPFDFRIGEFGSRNGGKYGYSTCNFYKEGFNYGLSFDDFKKGDFDEGLDKNFHMKSIKVIQFIMTYCAELKRLEELGETNYAFDKGYIGKIKDYNVIIPKENITSNRFTEAPFKSVLKKYSFLSSDEIYTKLKEQKDTENTAVLNVSRDDYAIFLNITDIKTGDLLYTANEGLGTFTQGKGINDEVIEKLLKKLAKFQEK